MAPGECSGRCGNRWSAERGSGSGGEREHSSAEGMEGIEEVVWCGEWCVDDLSGGGWCKTDCVSCPCPSCHATSGMTLWVFDHIRPSLFSAQLTPHLMSTQHCLYKHNALASYHDICAVCHPF